MTSNHRDPKLIDHYLGLLKNVPQRGAGLESISESDEVDLSDTGISARVFEADRELKRIIKEYLDDKPELHAIADQIRVTGTAALRLVRDRDEQALSKSPEALSSLETIVHIDGSRPSFLIRRGQVDRASSPIGTWGNTLDSSESTLSDIFPCVGRIDVPAAEQGFEGTGFLVAENLILTNRHVLQAIAARDEQKEWKFEDGVRIDFGHEFRGKASVNPRPLRSVVFCGPKPIEPSKPIDHSKLDLVLIELEPATSANRPRDVLPLEIAREWADPAVTIFTIGYPANPGFNAFTPTLLEQLFKSTFGFKRIAPGLIMKSKADVQPWTLAHDATTLGGNSGSVVLVAGREMIAAGLHYGGRRAEPRENWGHVLGRTLESPDAKSGKPLGEVLKEHHVTLIDSLGANG